jgi:hypothetical protein
VIIKNLWAKDIKVGDVIVDAELVDSRYGHIQKFTVSRVDPELEQATTAVLDHLREALNK